MVGIVNGTTNYILSAMAETGAGYAEALAEATGLGYAEADPTADVDGFDAAAKAAILASLAFHTRVTAADVHREGIPAVSAADIAAAPRDRLHRQAAGDLRARPAGDGDAPDDRCPRRVHPAMIPTTHPLAAVGGAFNAVFVEAEAAGQLMFYGQGAGGAPTASAVLGDLVAVARNRLAGGRGPRESAYAACRSSRWARCRRRYHVSLDVADRPGVLAAVARVRRGTGSASRPSARTAAAATTARRLVVVTHSAPTRRWPATVDGWRSWTRSAGSPACCGWRRL